MPVTIFEGPDGAGKSTLAEAWIRKLEARNLGKADVVTRSNHGPYLGQEEIANKYLEDLVLAIPPRHWHVIMDRCWISESVYGPAVRGRNRIGIAARRTLERLALAAGVLLVYCLPPYEECRKAYMARRHEEYLEDESQLRAVYDGFVSLVANASTSPLAQFYYDWTRDKHRDTLIEMAEELRPLTNEGPGIGHWAPCDATLMVLERSITQLPFMQYGHGSADAWLSEQLEEWGAAESGFYWVSALDAAGRPTNSAYWLDKLEPHRVIALGPEAHDWCLRLRLKFETAPAHEYWLRMHPDIPYPLKELLT